MKMSYEVFWASVAENDLLGIVEFISEDSTAVALDVLGKIKAHTAKLDSSPNRGRIVPELLRQGISNYREIIIKPWRVIYRVEVNKVFVVSILDGRRNIEDVLLGRMLR